MIQIGAIVWGVTDIKRAIAFWSAALNYQCKYEDVDFAILIPKAGAGYQLSLKKVTSPHARRHHMDLFASNKEEEVERLISLGATRKKWNYAPDADYTVLEDPDGNPFCVCQQ